MSTSPRVRQEFPIELFHFEKQLSRQQLRAKKPLAVKLGEIRPAIRLAHHLDETLNYKLRIIFDYMLFYVIDGGSTWTLGNKDTEISRGHLLLVPPFTPHSSTTGPNRKCEHLAIHFDWKPQFPRNTRADLGRTPYEVVLPVDYALPVSQVLGQYDPLPASIGKVVETWQGGGSLNHLHAEAQLFEVLVTLIKRAQSPSEQTESRHAFADQARINASIEFMKRHLHRPLDLAAVAVEVRLSPSRYSHLFRKITGHSPMEYLAMIRIQRAKELLEDVRLSIKEVAVQCGFEDPYYFSKVFSRLDGMPPSQYRESLLRPGLH